MNSKNLLRIITFILFFAVKFAYAQSGGEIISVSPEKAYPGDKVTLKLQNFKTSDPSTKVMFGKYEAKISSKGADEVTVIIPEKARVTQIWVENNDGKSNELKYYVLPYVEFKLSDSSIEAGKSFKGLIRVHGSKRPWTLQMINKYYEIVELDGGREVTLTTSGGEENTAEIAIKAIKKGNFNINFKVISGYDPKEKNTTEKSEDLGNKVVKANASEPQTKESVLKETPPKEPQQAPNTDKSQDKILRNDAATSKTSDDEKSKTKKTFNKSNSTIPSTAKTKSSAVKIMNKPASPDEMPDSSASNAYKKVEKASEKEKQDEVKQTQKASENNMVDNTVMPDNRQKKTSLEETQKEKNEVKSKPVNNSEGSIPDFRETFYRNTNGI